MKVFIGLCFLCMVFLATILAQATQLPTVYIRSEVSTLNEQDVLRLRSALRRLKEDDSKAGWQLLASFHGLPMVCPTPAAPQHVCCVHGMPTFFHWHRLYTLQLERALLRQGSDVGFPYWDWTKVMTSLPSLFANRRYYDPQLGRVVENPFFRSYIRQANTYTVRNPSSDLFTTSEDGQHSFLFDRVLLALEQTDYCIFQEQLEMVHNTVHSLVGSSRIHSMSFLGYASYDPIFFGHHGFIDKIWAVWQELQKRRGLPYDQADCAADLLDDPMLPFNLTTVNVDPFTRAHAIPQSVFDYRNLSYTYDNLGLGGVTLEELEGLIQQNQHRPRDFANFQLTSIGSSAKFSVSACTSETRCAPAGSFFLFGSPEEMPWAFKRPFKHDITKAVKRLSVAPENVRRANVFVQYNITSVNIRVHPKKLPRPSISFQPAS